MTLLPTYQGKSGSATNGTVTLVLGDATAGTGVTRISHLTCTVSGGSNAVTVTLTGLHSTYVDGITLGQLSYTIPPNTTLAVVPPEPITGNPTITISGTSGSSQTLAITVLNHFD